jgi:hypothetical protein
MTPEPFPGWLLEKFQEGIDGEPVVVNKLQQNGWDIYGRQHEVNLRFGSKIVVRGHLDGCGRLHGGPERVVEVKCVSEGYADEIRRALPPLYHWQCAVYGRVLGLPVTLALGIKDDDGWVQQVECIDLAIAGVVAVKLRVMSIEQHIRDGTWPSCSYRMFPCPFPELCDDEAPEATEDWELEAKLRESLVAIRQ